jgi:glutamyl-tRNA(Gln) amidotransferase subunit D
VNLSEQLSGYKGEVEQLLKQAKAEIGDILRITKGNETYEGILIPRSEYGDDKHLVIKLKNGYNTGIRINQETKIQKIGAGTKPTFVAPSLPKQKPNLPKVAIISTGGTIASRVDYRTGAVRPALTASDLYSVVPELSEIATIDAQILFNVFSEDITSKHWTQLAKTIAERIEKHEHGIVVAHGTDTMGYTAAALSFALQNLPVPIIIVGAQRSADRPSSDAATNLTGAVVAAAKGPFAEVILAMHETPSDTSIVLHRGTKVRKCHTSRRDTFKSINSEPLAKIKDNEVIMLAKKFHKRDPSNQIVVKPNFEQKVALLKFHPDFNPELVDSLVSGGFRGIILEGTGLGHISNACMPHIRSAIRKGVIVGMTSQCIWGRVDMNVYYRGRDLISLGVIPLEDMLAETALVKTMWILGQTKDTEEAKRLLVTNIANEISARTTSEPSRVEDT